MSETTIESLRSKFTRGDKCIIIHVAVTLLIILILVIIYVVHILLVTHEGLDFLRISRRTLKQPSIDEEVNLRLEVPNYNSVGVAYIKVNPAKIVCSTILLRHQWSLAPAHCVTIRSDPELSQLLPKWKLKYTDETDQETDIKRGMVHSFYNKDDFDNNIGLFEHMDHIQIPGMTFPDKVVSDLLKESAEDLVIVGWSKVDKISSNSVRLLKQEKCSQFVSPIVDAPRKNELCVLQISDESMIGVHGGALVLKSQIVGFFSWGDRSGIVPQVVLVVEPYKGWMDSMMAMSI